MFFFCTTVSPQKVVRLSFPNFIFLVRISFDQPEWLGVAWIIGLLPPSLRLASFAVSYELSSNNKESNLGVEL